MISVVNSEVKQAQNIIIMQTMPQGFLKFSTPRIILLLTVTPAVTGVDVIILFELIIL